MTTNKFLTCSECRSRRSLDEWKLAPPPGFEQMNEAGRPRLRPGDRVVVADEGGVNKGRTGIVVPWSEVPLTGHGVPNLPGEYKPLDSKRRREELPVRADNGEIFTMYKGLLRKISEKTEPSSSQSSQLNEEAQLVCPVCGTSISLSASLKHAVTGDEEGIAVTPPGTPPGAPAGAPVGRGGPQGVGAPTQPPGATYDSYVPPGRTVAETATVLGCAMCGNEWAGLEHSCPECGERKMVTEIKKTVRERVMDVVHQANAGVPLDRAMDMLLGNGRGQRGHVTEKTTKWTGTLSEYNSKIQDLVSRLGMNVDLGELTDALMDDGALRIKGKEITLDTKKATLSIQRFAANEGIDISPERPARMSTVVGGNEGLNNNEEEDDIPLPPLPDDDDELGNGDDEPLGLGPPTRKRPPPPGRPRTPSPERRPSASDPKDVEDDIEKAVNLYFV